MDREDIRNAIFNGGIERNRTIFSKIMDKWSLMVLYMLDKQSPMRFNELHRSIPDISQKMLTSTLKNLESLKLVKRTVIAAVPVKVEYRLEEKTSELISIIDSLLVMSIKEYGHFSTKKQDSSRLLRR